jgi:TetR/AcrR family transcriptional regulator
MSSTLLERAAPTHRRARRKQERPGELLDAALALFVEKGYAATRMEEVASRAGVSKGTVFLYFPSKLDLFKAVVKHNISDRFEQWNARFEQFDGTSAELLRLTMLLWWERIGSTRASGISKLMMSEGGNFPEMAGFFHQAVIQPGQNILRSVIQRGIERGEFQAVQIDHAVHGVVSVLVFLALSRHCPSLCTQELMKLDPVAYINDQARFITQALSAPVPLSSAFQGSPS